MQPSPLPRPKAAFAAAKMLLLAVAVLAAVSGPASAMVVMGGGIADAPGSLFDSPRTMVAMRTTLFTFHGVGVWYEVDPETGQATFKACIEHDPDWHFPFDQGRDEDGHYAVWVSKGTDPSAGSEKASTACIPADGMPSDLPPAPELPIYIWGSS